MRKKGRRRRRLAFEISRLIFPSQSHLGRLDLEREVVGDALDVAREHVVREELHGFGLGEREREREREKEGEAKSTTAADFFFFSRAK